MKKRLLSLTLAAAMTLSLAGCRGGAAETTAAPEATTTAKAAEATTAADGAETEAQAETVAPAGNFKIGIITGTASQGDEEITQAGKMKEKYGDMIVTSTYGF